VNGTLFDILYVLKITTKQLKLRELVGGAGMVSL